MLSMRDCERLNFKKGECLFEAGTKIDKVYLVISGSASARSNYIRMNLENGSMIGLIDLCAEQYLYNYYAETDMAVLSFRISGIEEIDSVRSLGVNYQELIDRSMLYQFGQIYQVYTQYFDPFLHQLAQMQDERAEQLTVVDKDTCQYLCDIGNLEKSIFHGLFSEQNHIASYHISMITKAVKQVNSLICEVLEQFNPSVFGFTLLEAVEEVPTQEETNEEAAEDVAFDYALVNAECKDSLKQILDYAELDAQETMKFQMLVDNYRTLPDRLSSDNGVRELRKRISEEFYKIYEAVFLKSRKDTQISRVIELFLNFGYMEEREFDRETLAELYYFKPERGTVAYHVYTIYEWLCAIYEGKREPSKNEYDSDYKEQFRELKKSRPFTKAEENAYFSDQDAKVRFEIENMMRVTNRITSGEITVFCPILSQTRFTQQIKQMFLSEKKIAAALDSVLDIDYSLFHREQMYYDDNNKIENIMVQKQVLPDVILMPNVGSRGIMWQEVSEKKRDTPARFVLPEFFIGDLNSVMITLAGTFRWEMCRTIQGNYWNDLREHSLTADYCDYIQFYRKNKDLSEEVKEKVRTQYKNCRNNTRDMFVKDYESWIKYEAKGALRLNKVTRRILYIYCPAAIKYRENLEKQPVFAEAVGQFSRDRVKKIKELKGFHSNIEKRGGTVTKILEDNLAFYEEM